jgi:Rap1a immunity proteins
MRNLIRSGLAILVALSAPTAQAVVTGDVFMSGNYLYERCTSQHADMQMECLGYVLGIADAISQANAFAEETAAPDAAHLGGWKACIPVVGVVGGQLVDIVKRYLTKHPEKRHLAAVSLVAGAFQEAFPCKP